MNHKLTQLIKANTVISEGRFVLTDNAAMQEFKDHYQGPLWNSYITYKSGRSLTLARYAAKGYPDNYPDLKRKGHFEPPDQ